MINSEGVVRILNHDGQIVTQHKDKITTTTYGARVITIKPNDDTTVDISTSCNKAVAVAKLLGWMKGSIFPKILVIASNDKGDVYLDLYHILANDEHSLQEMLSHMRDVTNEVLATAKADATSEELEEKKDALANIDALIHKAFMYTSDIDEELSKDEGSELKIDRQRTEETGVTHITLKSLDQWAKQKYVISILDDQEQHTSPEGTQAHPVKQVLEEDVDPNGGSPSLAARNVLVTFGFLIEAFAETATGFGKDKPNQKAIAKHLKDLAAKAAGQSVMENQSYESIRKRLKQAIDTKNAYLKNR